MSELVENPEDRFSRVAAQIAFLHNVLIYSSGSFEPPRGKTNNVVPEQVRHKPACTSTGKS